MFADSDWLLGYCTTTPMASSPPSRESLPKSLVVLSPVVPLIDYSLPIVVHKGKHTCTSYSTARYVSYDHLFSSLRAFTTSVSSVHVPKSVLEASSTPD